MSYNINEEGTWLTGARVVSSPNCDARPLDVEIDLLIIHAISLPPKEYGGGYIDKLFTNTLTPDEHPYFMKIKELLQHLVKCKLINQFIKHRLQDGKNLQNT